MKVLFENWKSYLSEDKEDPTYSQDTYNAFVLLALSSERGGNRDEVKNDIRAIPEVLTVTPVERADGGVQKRLADYFLSTMKLRVRLPRGIQRDILTQQIVNDINNMRGVSVRRHTSEPGTEVREEQDYQKSPERAQSLRKGFDRITKGGPNKAGPFKQMPLDPDWKSAPPGAPGGLEEGETWDAVKKWAKEKAEDVKDYITDKDWEAGEATGPPPAPKTSPVDWADPVYGPKTPEEMLDIDNLEDLRLSDRPIAVPGGTGGKPQEWQSEYRPAMMGRETDSMRWRVKHPKSKKLRYHAGIDLGKYRNKEEWLQAMEREALTPETWLTDQDLEGLRLSPLHKKKSGLFAQARGPTDPLSYKEIEKEAWKRRKEIVAPTNIEIIAVRKLGGYGNQVVGRFCDKSTEKCYHTSFNHLKNKSHLKVGDKVRIGEKIGDMGNTGVGTGAHLHHELWEEPSHVDLTRPERYPGEKKSRERKSVRGFLNYGKVPNSRYTDNISWTDFYEAQPSIVALRQQQADRALTQEPPTSSVDWAVPEWHDEEPEPPRDPDAGYKWAKPGELRERALKTEACGPDHKKKIKIKIRPGGGKLITSFEVQPNLNPEVWEGDQLQLEIKERLREIAEEFIEKLDLPNVDIKDIILTGSLANYNWSEYSDLDVHIVIDFKDVAEDEGLVKKYFDAVRANWNRNHDIKVKGFEVELYVQDDDESHASTGIYSLLDDGWLLKPSREHKEIDKLNIFKKARHIMRDIDKVERHLDRQEYAAALTLGQGIKDKIKRMRRGGLQRGGVYSTENLAFKVLRRGGYMGKLLDSVGTAYDAQRSLAEQE